MIHFTLVVIIVTTAGPAPSPTAVQEQPIVQPEQPRPRDPGLIWMSCDKCEWFGGYESMASAKMGAASHRRWCAKGHGRKKQLFGV